MHGLARADTRSPSSKAERQSRIFVREDGESPRWGWKESEGFVLVRNQMFCCFGAVPMMNEWLHVKMEGDARAPFIADVPIRVYGTFDVGEVVTKGTLMSIYRMDAADVEVTAGY